VTLDKLVAVGGAAWMFSVFAYSIYDPRMVIRWAKTAHPSLSEFAPEVRRWVRAVGVGGTIVAGSCLIIALISFFK
jgi:hypothetical protein